MIFVTGTDKPLLLLFVTVMSGDDSTQGTVVNGFPEQMDEILSISSWLIVVCILTPIEKYVLLSLYIDFRTIK